MDHAYAALERHGHGHRRRFAYRGSKLAEHMRLCKASRRRPKLADHNLSKLDDFNANCAVRVASQIRVEENKRVKAARGSHFKVLPSAMLRVTFGALLTRPTVHARLKMKVFRRRLKKQLANEEAGAKPPEIRRSRALARSVRAAASECNLSATTVSAIRGVVSNVILERPAP